MSNDPPDDHDGSQTTTSFEEWIERQAEVQGVSRQELFEQLVSSYWTVSEMAELIDEPGDDPVLPTSAADSADDESADSEPESSAADDGSELADIDSFEELIERLENIETEPGPEAQGRSGTDLVSTLADRLTWLEAGLSADRPDEGRSAGAVSPDRSTVRSERRSPVSGLQDRIDTLDDRLEAIEDNITDEQEHTGFQDEFLEAVAERLNRIETRIDGLASETEAGREVLADRVDEIESDADDLAAEVEAVDRSLSSEYESVADRLDDIESSVDGRHRQLANEQQRLRSRLDAEFEDLETILEYLMAQVDDLDSGLVAAEQRHDDDLSQIRQERDALRSLLSKAAERDVHAGECGVCGEQVNLDLLADPYCSGCGSLLTGIEEQDKWLFFSDTIVTAEGNRTGPGGEPREATPETRGDEASPIQGPPGQTTGRDPPPRPTDRQSNPAETEQTRSAGTTGEAGSPGSVLNNEASDDSPVDSGSIDFGRSDDDSTKNDATEPGSDSKSRPGFSLGDLETQSDTDGDSGPDPAAGTEHKRGASGAETTDDAPFGDLEGLKPQDEQDDT
jgi:predicted  nucleic acid-binding Zn-ribbon protein